MMLHSYLGNAIFRDGLKVQFLFFFSIICTKLVAYLVVMIAI